ncbi:MAG TPA: sigma factor-like helix-turn-helix DNA-binding protein [Eubacteriales bacterium]|nr:sigma factor-like helix-turn-helix DNA-binding protein [Eubacteriales bacterium]
MALSNEEIIILCDLYGSLLTEKQLGMLRLFYDFDNSLSEIAEQYGVTRQAVRDSIVKATETLETLESKLRIHTKFDKIKILSEHIKDNSVDSADDARNILEVLAE